MGEREGGGGGDGVERVEDASFARRWMDGERYRSLLREEKKGGRRPGAYSEGRVVTRGVEVSSRQDSVSEQSEDCRHPFFYDEELRDGWPGLLTSIKMWCEI